MTTGKYELVIRWPSGQSTLCGEMTDHQHGEICRILSPDHRAELSAIKGAAEPVAWQFQGRDGKWCNFMDERHRLATIEDGTWPIRELYTRPPVVAEAEPVKLDVVGYASPGQIEVLRSVPLTGGMKVKGLPNDRYSEPLVLLSAAKSAVFQAVIRCEQKGAFKTCLECGYQDGHDPICQYHESKRAPARQTVTREDAEQFLAAYHAEVWAAAEDEDSRVAYDDAGRELAKAFLARFDDAACAPPASGAVPVSRELLERVTMTCYPKESDVAELRALLAKGGQS